MIIRTTEIKSSDIPGIITELEAMPKIIEFIRGYNLPGGDILEAMASDMLYSGNDIDTNNYRVDSRALYHYTVRLSDNTVGKIETEKDLNTFIGREIEILLHDENGNDFEKSGILAEILLEEYVL